MGLPSFTEFLTVITDMLRVQNDVNLVLPSFTEFYQLLPSFDVYRNGFT